MASNDDMDDMIVIVGKRLIVLEARNPLTRHAVSPVPCPPSTNPSTCSRVQQAWPGWAVGRRVQRFQWVQLIQFLYFLGLRPFVS